MTVAAPGFTIGDFAIDDFDAVHAPGKQSGLWMRPSDGRDQVLLKLERDPDLFLVARDADGSVDRIGSRRLGRSPRLRVPSRAWCRRGSAAA